MQTRSDIDEALWRSSVYEAFAIHFAPKQGDERYLELFGHTVRGLVSPYETEYGTDESLFLPAHELADISAFLSAFGLALDAAAHERADHVRSECELMAFLARKEAFAREHEDVAMAEETRKAQRLFLRDHLGRFAPAFGAELARNDADGFYGELGQALRSFVTGDCARFDVSVGPPRLELRVVSDDDVPSACDNCNGAEAACEGVP
jgi:TorA maturation chaperone TorD